MKKAAFGKSDAAFGKMPHEGSNIRTKRPEKQRHGNTVAIRVAHLARRAFPFSRDLADQLAEIVAGSRPLLFPSHPRRPRFQLLIQPQLIQQDPNQSRPNLRRVQHLHAQ